VTARFIDIADLAREAHYDAAAKGEAVVPPRTSACIVFENGAAQP